MLPVATSQEFVPIHTIESRHVLDAIPGDTLRAKLQWVQARTATWACACGGDCNNGANAAARAAVKELGEIEGVFSQVYDIGVIQALSGSECMQFLGKIADIVDGVE